MTSGPPRRGCTASDMSASSLRAMTLADHGAVPSSDVVVVRQMTAHDVAFAAALHETALPHGFFGRLGPRFLSSYYQAFVDSPHAVAFVAQSHAGPVGVI